MDVGGAVLPFAEAEMRPVPPTDGPILLSKARQAKGWSVSQLAQATRITGNAIEALEAGDLEYFAGRIYVLGFARALAKAVGVDAEAVDLAFRTLIEQRDPVWRRST